MRRALVVVVGLVAMLSLALPAWSQAPAPDAKAAARELVLTMRAADQLKTVFPMLMQQLKPAIVQGRKDVEKDYDTIMPQILAQATARMDEFVEAIAGVYAQHFTADELRKLTQFYKEPVGQKFIQLMPQIMQDSMTVGQKFGESLAADMRDKMMEKLREKGHKL
jgi:hypothetical protein